MFTRLGRPHTLAVAPLAFLAWVLLTYFASSAGHLYAARLLAGTGMGVNFTFSSIYLGEMATPIMRSVLILVMTLLAPSGQLLSFVIGPYLTYWQEVRGSGALFETRTARVTVCSDASQQGMIGSTPAPGPDPVAADRGVPAAAFALHARVAVLPDHEGPPRRRREGA